MFIFKKYRLLNQAGDDGAAGGGAAGDDSATSDGVTNSGDASASAADDSAAAKSAAADANQGGSGGMTDKERELLRESMTRKEKIKELEAKLGEAANNLKIWEGLDPADVKKLVQERKESEMKALEKKGEFDKIRQQMLEAHETEKKTLKDQIDALNQKVNVNLQAIDQLTVGQAFSTSRFISDELVLTPTKARTVYGGHFERDESGVVVAYDKPAGSPNRAPLVDGQGNPLPFDLALQKIVEADPDRDALLKAKIKPGAGSGTTGAKKQSDDSKEAPAGVSRIADALRAGGLKKFSRV